MKRARSKRSSSPAKSPLPAPMSRGRRWIFRLTAMVLVPLLFILMLEAVLRLSGFGHSTSFFLPMQINGKKCLVENDRFGWRFFGPEMARAPLPLVMPQVKPPGTTRVFVFGESAAFGDPQPEFGLCRILETLLNSCYPDQPFEVINTAMTAINSHVILPIARDCAAQNGDFWVLYMGNNEVVGPYGAGTVFGAKAPNLALVRANVALKASFIGQALGDLARQAQRRSVNESEWGGMVMFQSNHVRLEDPRMATVYASFGQNLNDIIDAGVRSGAKVVVSTVACNHKDCGPFASDHRPGLGADQLARWENSYRKGIQSQLDGKAWDAISFFKDAIKIDDTFAEAHFRLGQSFLKLGQDAEAASQFKLACDLDTLRFRADSRINDIIRQTTGAKTAAGVRLADSDSIMAAQSPHGITGQEFLYEHVHLNFEGNYLVARAMAEKIGEGLAPTGRPWATVAQCAERLGWSDYARHQAEVEILGRLYSPPFNAQASHQEQYQNLIFQIEKTRFALLPEGLKDAVYRAQIASGFAPGDWILQRNLAHLQQLTGDIAGAVASYEQVVRLLPQDPQAWQNLGLALEMANRASEAIPAFQEAARLHPESVASLNSLAELYIREGKYEAAAREFQKVLKKKPYWGPAHLGLGKVLEAQGKTSEANKEYGEALKNRIVSPDSFSTLAKFSFSKGWYDAAVTNFGDLLRLDPSNPETRVNLGLALDKLGKSAEATAQFTEAIRLAPDFAEARFCLGLELGQQGDPAGAVSQFTEVVRLKPEMIEARLNLGIALANQHLGQQALQQFDEVLRRDPANQMARNQIALLRPKSAAPPPGR